jgi:hypothetical protein
VFVLAVYSNPGKCSGFISNIARKTLCSKQMNVNVVMRHSMITVDEVKAIKSYFFVKLKFGTEAHSSGMGKPRGLVFFIMSLQQLCGAICALALQRHRNGCVFVHGIL